MDDLATYMRLVQPHLQPYAASGGRFVHEHSTQLLRALLPERDIRQHVVPERAELRTAEEEAQKECSKRLLYHHHQRQDHAQKACDCTHARTTGRNPGSEEPVGRQVDSRQTFRAERKKRAGAAVERTRTVPALRLRHVLELLFRPDNETGAS